MSTCSNKQILSREAVELDRHKNLITLKSMGDATWCYVYLNTPTSLHIPQLPNHRHLLELPNQHELKKRPWGAGPR